jgi:hypothetical protein
MKRFVLAVLLAGCKDIEVEDPGAPRCVDVGKRVFEIAGTQTEEEHVAQCKSFSKNRKRCYVSANNADGLAKCDRDDMIAKGVDMEGPDCSDVWNHYATTLALEGAAKNTARPEVTRTCTTMTRAQKECWLQATTGDAMQRCAKR